MHQAIGAAQLLGLHCNSASWRLPHWERCIRKRLWWSLLIADKWYVRRWLRDPDLRNAFAYGRPSNMRNDATTVPRPTLEDDDWHGLRTHSEQHGLTAFIAMCRLTVILDSLLPLLDGNDTSTSTERRKQLGSASTQLREIDVDLPSLAHGGDTQFSPGHGTPLLSDWLTSASYRLSSYGIGLAICRLGLDTVDNSSVFQASNTAVHAFALVTELVVFLERLKQ